MRAPSSNELPNLDILRALAVLLVVVDHSAKFFGLPADRLNTLGATGVYLFFVHTCLVLMQSLERQQAKSREHLIVVFYIRRLFRIYPLSAFFVLMVTAFAIPAERISGASQIALFPASIGDVLSNLALTMNLTGHTPIMGQLWSLPLEVQMYLILPAAYLFSRRFGARGVFACWCGSVVIAMLHSAKPFPGSWRLTLLDYVPCFIPGVLAYALRQSRPRIGARWWPVTLLGLCGGYYLITSSLTRWSMCLAIGVAIPFFHQAGWPWLTRPAHYIAKYSYGIYLGHLLALWIGFTLVGGPLAIQVLAWVTSLVLIPVAAFHFLESPCIGIGVRLSARLGGKKHIAAAATTT